MEQELIQIKCPSCGALLSVKYYPGIEAKYVTCPICKQRAQYTQYRQAEQKEEHTQINELKNTVIGVLRSQVDGKVYPLVKGKNIIGREAKTSSATLQIDTHGSRRVSREHLVIEVKDHPLLGITHNLSLYKPNLNETRINGQVLEFGDIVKLSDHNTIQLPDIQLTFTLPDSESTTTDF